MHWLARLKRVERQTLHLRADRSFSMKHNSMTMHQFTLQ